jgi:hypothetical protein
MEFHPRLHTAQFLDETRELRRMLLERPSVAQRDCVAMRSQPCL